MITMDTPQTPEDIPRLFADAWNSRNAKALAHLFAKDAEFVNVVGLWWHNRDDIERAHDYGLRTFFKASTISARRVEIKNWVKTLPLSTCAGDWLSKLARVETRWKIDLRS